MGILKKLAGLFGFGQEDDYDDDVGESSGDGDNHPKFRETGLPRKGFGVPVQVAVEKSRLGPVLQPSAAGDGGVQGLRWYTKQLLIDEDGDVADEFFEEILTEKATNDAEDDHLNCDSKTSLRLQSIFITEPAKVRRLVVSSDGKLQQCIEHQGKLLIV
ncbi:unnamed protein product [Cochlearia groenlandica]